MARHPLHRAFLAAAFSLGAGLSAAGCSDGQDLLDDACRTVVNECASCQASGSECIDLLGPQPPECLDCIVASGAGYADNCDSTATQTGPCRLPPELIPE